jgi:FAD/FMN-containing dehydrogenase
VRFATSAELPFVVRAGGHSLEGFSLVDGGLVIDVTRIDYVRVDKSQRTATVGAGVRSLALARQLAAFNLHFPGSGDGDVGIAGLTLGGGFGPTSRQFGLACDNLLELVLVTADGELITANETLRPDLLWAHRGGGGGNFGVVVSMTLRLHELPAVYLFNAVWPAEQAVEALAVWQDYSTSPQSKLGLYAGLNKIYGKTGQVEAVLGMAGVFVGDEAEAREALAPLFSVGTPRLSLAQTTDYVGVLTNLFAYAAPQGKWGSGSSQAGPAAQKVKSAYAARAWMPSEFKLLVDGYTAYKKIAFVSLENYGGVVNSVPVGATAFPHRSSAFLAQIGVFWLEESERAEAEAWIREYFAGLQPFLSSSVYVNYPDLELEDYAGSYYGENLERLRCIKAEVDPGGVFTFAQSL